MSVGLSVPHIIQRFESVGEGFGSYCTASFATHLNVFLGVAIFQMVNHHEGDGSETQISFRLLMSDTPDSQMWVLLQCRCGVPLWRCCPIGEH